MASQAQLCRMTPPLCELKHATSTFHSFDPDDGYISNRSLQRYKPDAQSAVAWAERSDGVTPINVFMHAIQNIVVDA
ncbi:uncharacterized protein F5891DRAFT_1192599 [Suillus fuscotomentosus]|uniref:Uncharacterized protein n=1 Tax=Suillus fuscotomentosus TaxID=1912939 RepID=A0AAD4E0G0_9AGAM|nr:uncharacterized protein F5891DRAFT_1192599 [Suillus fuscotomentosus]KAG1896941.1 hypothetical protein F5891DRAFT_1192599 [Suillus fuscotomentosus]